MFLLEALPAVILGIIVTFTLEDSVASAGWLTAAKKEVLSDDISAEIARLGPGKSSVSEVVKDRRIWLLCFIYFTVVVGQYGLTFWMPTLIHGTGARARTTNGWLSDSLSVCGSCDEPLRLQR